jgi:serine phosphatase RsbU (regulator of sigma subunit)
VRRVLVVDDDPDINRLVCLRLGAYGYEVDSAANGEEALDRLHESPPDLMYVDVSMPGIGGLEVLDHVRATNLDAAVVMMTAFGSEVVAVDALRRGADDYLRKPFDRQEFQGVLVRTVSRLALQRENVSLQRRLETQRLELESELTRAARVQADLLPTKIPAVPGFELAACCLPAREVGGDYYDWQIDHESLTLTLADVMGKGMPAALLMATVRSAVRTVALELAPAAAIGRVAASLAGDLAGWGGFVTLFHARLEPCSRRLTYVDAGHGHAFVKRAGGEVEVLSPRGFPLGVLDGVVYEEGETVLAPGDTLVLYSDGLVDANPDLELDRTALAAHVDAGASAAEIVARLAAIPKLTALPPDDLTVMVLCSRAVGET